jgi:hypothetical protein
MPTEEVKDTPINAEPTKGFFVDMITRDISLEQAVLDLVDNSVDGAKLHRGVGERPLEGFEVAITISGVRFRIVDNCGGFSKETARDYAFRFGRPPGREKLEYSLGRFGIGMKRALFKFGEHFTVEASTEAESWGINIDVPAWQDDPGWTFPWAEVSVEAAVSVDNPGTDITVDRLKPEVSARFGTAQFVTAIENVIKAKHRQFISEGLAISVNGRHLVATSLSLLIADRLQPGVDTFKFEAGGKDPVDVRIVVGVGESVPSAAGWYVVCNGRVILEADRSKENGWGVAEEENDEILIPKFHNQFARFRGIVTFDSADAARVPWNTMKDDVDRESAVWQQTFE